MTAAHEYFCVNPDCDAVTNGEGNKQLGCWKCGAALRNLPLAVEEPDGTHDVPANSFAERLIAGVIGPVEAAHQVQEMQDGRRQLAMRMLDSWRIAENMARAAKDQWNNVYLSGGPGDLADEMKAIYKEARAKADEKRNEIIELMGVDS